MSDPALGLRVVTPGPAGRLDVAIRWLHTTELPDPSLYIRPGELVLTNGLWLPHHPVESFVDAVARARAAGLVFGLTSQTPEIPPDLAESCRSRDLPLIELCIDVAFTKLTKAASHIQNEVLQAELTATVHRGDALAESLSRGGGAAGVLEILRRDRDLPLLVVDRAARRLAGIGRELTNEQLQTAAAALNLFPPPLEVAITDRTSAALYLIEGAMGEINAGLYCLAPLAELTAADRDALAQAARFLSLEVAKQQAVHAIEARFAGELLEMILSGPGRANEVTQRLHTYGVPPDQPLAVLAIAAPAEAADAGALQTIRAAVSEVFSAHGLPAFTCARSRDVVAIAPWERSIEDVTRLAHEISGKASQRVNGQRIVVGIGEIANDASALREPLVRAREICEVLLGSNGPAVAIFTDIATYRMLLGLLDRRVLHHFSEQVLGPIRGHDDRVHTDLEHTLRTFLDHDGQWATTASALHVHVNTLRNRMARIGELTGRDVNRMADRIDLFLALEAGTVEGKS